MNGNTPPVSSNADCIKKFLIAAGMILIEEKRLSSPEAHFGNHDNPTGSTIYISTEEANLHNIADSFQRLNDLKPGTVAFVLEIVASFLQESKSPYYRPQTESNTKLTEWEPVRLLEHDLFLQGKGTQKNQILKMFFPPRVIADSEDVSGTSKRFPSVRRTGTLSQSSPLLSQPSPSLSQPSPSSAETRIAIKPTATYWLRRETIELRSLRLIPYHTFVSTLDLIAPYLSVMIVDTSKDSAQGRLALSASTALYNRFLLKMNSREWDSSAQETVKEFSDLRHYGLLFQRSQFHLWCFTPKLAVDAKFETQSPNRNSSPSSSGTEGSQPSKGNAKQPRFSSVFPSRKPRTPTSATQDPVTQPTPTAPRWEGFFMTPLHWGDLVEYGVVENLVNFINSIHYWGLNVHGPGIGMDLVRCFAADTVGSV